MSTLALDSLVNVRYYSPTDPYHYSVDNRPLTDLQTNVTLLAGLIDGLVSGNVFYLQDSSNEANLLNASSPLFPTEGPYEAGQLATIKVNNNNTGPATLTINSGVEYPIHGMVGELQGGELIEGKHYLISWENSDSVWELVGAGKGSLQVAQATQDDQAVNLGQLKDGTQNPVFALVTTNNLDASGVINAGSLVSTGNAYASAGTEGNQLINYTQITNSTLSPVFENIVSNGIVSVANFQELTSSVITPSVSGWTEVLNLAEGTVQVVTLNSSGTIDFSSAAPSGFSSFVFLYLIQGGSGSNTVTWPLGTMWPGGTPPVLSGSSGDIDIVALTTYNNGSNWFGFLFEKNFRVNPPVFLAISATSFSYSSDGRIWSTPSDLPSGVSWFTVRYGNGIFVALGNANGYCYAAYSTDMGQTWTLNPSYLANGNQVSSLAFGDGIFMAVGAQPLTYICTSPDGITWTTLQPSGLNDARTGRPTVSYENGSFVFFSTYYVQGTGEYNSQAFYSTDQGQTWSAGNTITDPLNDRWSNVCYGDGVYIVSLRSVAGYTGGLSFMSSDGAQGWTYGTLPNYVDSGGDGIGWSHIAYGDGTFVALQTLATGTNPIILFSVDNGQTWYESSVSSATYGALESITYSNGIFVITTSNGCLVSTDGGQIFNVGFLSPAQSWLSVTYGT